MSYPFRPLFGDLAKHSTTRPAFTLVELLIVLGLIALVLSLAIPSLSAARREARLLHCMRNAASLHQIASLYCIDYRGLAPALIRDDSRVLEVASNRRAFMAYPVLLLEIGPLPQFSGIQPGSKQIMCPDNQPSRQGYSEQGYLSDYSLSASFYFDAAYLSPNLSPDLWSPFRAKIQFIDGAMFPSAKATFFERSVWHSWRGSFSPAANLVGLQPRWTTGKISISFADGHSEQLLSTDLCPSVERNPELPYQELDLTPWGVRGRDKR